MKKLIVPILIAFALLGGQSVRAMEKKDEFFLKKELENRVVNLGKQGKLPLVLFIRICFPNAPIVSTLDYDLNEQKYGKTYKDFFKKNCIPTDKNQKETTEQETEDIMNNNYDAYMGFDFLKSYHTIETNNSTSNTIITVNQSEIDPNKIDQSENYIQHIKYKKQAINCCSCDKLLNDCDISDYIITKKGTISCLSCSLNGDSHNNEDKQLKDKQLQKKALDLINQLVQNNNNYINYYSDNYIIKRKNDRY